MWFLLRFAVVIANYRSCWDEADGRQPVGHVLQQPPPALGRGKASASPTASGFRRIHSTGMLPGAQLEASPRLQPKRGASLHVKESVKDLI